MQEHIYSRTGREESSIFEVERPSGSEEVENDDDILDDFSGSSSEEGKDSEVGDKVIFFIKKYKFFIRLITLNILYFLSLEHCNDSYKHCYSKFHTHFIYWGVYLLVSALIFCNLVICAYYDILGSLGFGNQKGNYFQSLDTFQTLLL